MAQRIQFRRDTAANWASANPTLAEWELGFETDTWQFKIGNGVDDYTTLPFASWWDTTQIEQDILDLQTDKADKVLNNLTAVVDPTVNDDETLWYAPMSIWYNSNTNEYFKNFGAAQWAAVWIKSSLTIDELWTMATEDVDDYYDKNETDALLSDKLDTSEVWVTVAELWVDGKVPLYQLPMIPAQAITSDSINKIEVVIEWQDISSSNVLYYIIW